MPELPEVETVRRGLAPALAGARLVRVEARRPDLRFPLPANFTGRLKGARVEGLDRRGKYLLAGLDTGETLIVHLGMTGRFAVAGRDGGGSGGAGRHAHVVFETDAGAQVTFFDPRRFGFMDLVATAALGAYPAFARMGPEPFGDAFHPAALAAALAGRRGDIKTRLLDQSVVAGLGNIYVCEVLHRARISPLRAAGEVTPAAIGRLVGAVRAVLEEAINSGGSTLRDYAGADGAPGYFQHHFDVYGRAGQPCLRRRCAGQIARIVQAGRSTFHCPRCQT